MVIDCLRFLCPRQAYSRWNSRLNEYFPIPVLDANLVQTWCRGKKWWESETLCLDCHKFSWRDYRDPDFMTPEDFEKQRWEALVKQAA